MSRVVLTVGLFLALFLASLRADATCGYNLCEGDSTHYCAVNTSCGPVESGTPEIFLSCVGWDCSTNPPYGGTNGYLQDLLANIGGSRFLNTATQYYSGSDSSPVYATNPVG